MSSPAYHDPFANYRELTLRGMVLGALITVVFTASNVYLGLKVGLTFASSLPTAAIFWKTIWCKRKPRPPVRFLR